MNTEIIPILNLKCGGCATTIHNKISELPGVQKVVVNHDQNTVEVLHDEDTSRQAITNLLKKLGYPENTDKNSLLTQAKSYVSCMIGRVG